MIVLTTSAPDAAHEYRPEADTFRQFNVTINQK